MPASSTRLGASELLKTICAAPTGTVARAMYGTMGGVPPEDYRAARVILLWGVNPSATSIHLVPHVRAAQRAGAFVAAIDPRRTPLARSADLHLAVRPGTDAALALAMIGEIVRRGAADRAFLSEHASGVEALRAAAAEWPIERACRRVRRLDRGRRGARRRLRRRLAGRGALWMGGGAQPQRWPRPSAPSWRSRRWRGSSASAAAASP
jgi:anaerobic selenocysteine-containing dehydrogenase